MNVLSLVDTTLYDQEVSGLKRLGYRLKIPAHTVFHYRETRLIATKQVGKNTVKVHMTAMPAHFFTIEIPTVEGNTFILKTGSGSIDDYLEQLQPAINLIQESMLTVHEKTKKS